MTWGIGAWGTSPWGIATAGVVPPSLIAVSTPYGNLVERRGGTILTIVGTAFDDTAVVSILTGAVVVGTGYIFDPKLDVTENRIYAGAPALDDGVYGVRVTTTAGSVELPNVIEYRLFAEEMKVHRVRIGWAQPWQTGPRLLTNPTIGM